MKKTQKLRPLAFEHNESAVHKAIQQAAQCYLSDRNDHRFADGITLCKMVILAVLCLLCYWFSLEQVSGLAFFGCYFGFIFFGMLLMVNVVHDASHNAFFRAGWANVVINRLVTIPLGLDPECWRVRHVIFHHTHTNIAHYDPDIDENGVLRQTPFQRWKPFMRVQHWYWPLVAAMTFPWYIWFVDWLDRAGRTRVTARMSHQGLHGISIFLLGKGAHFALALGIPALVLPDSISFLTILSVYLLSQMASSLLFVMIIVGTHWAKANFFEAPDAGKMPHGWYHHNFAATFDWHPRPAWIGFWLGGANLHLTHHLFPNWSHRHYPALSEILREAAIRFDMDYQNLSLRELLRLQHRFLRGMGVKPPCGREE